MIKNKEYEKIYLEQMVDQIHKIWDIEKDWDTQKVLHARAQLQVLCELFLVNRQLLPEESSYSNKGEKDD